MVGQVQGRLAAQHTCVSRCALPHPFCAYAKHAQQGPQRQPPPSSVNAPPSLAFLTSAAGSSAHHTAAGKQHMWAGAANMHLWCHGASPPLTHTHAVCWLLCSCACRARRAQHTPHTCCDAQLSQGLDLLHVIHGHLLLLLLLLPACSVGGCVQWRGAQQAAAAAAAPPRMAGVSRRSRQPAACSRHPAARPAASQPALTRDPRSRCQPAALPPRPSWSSLLRCCCCCGAAQAW
jgi:hypothetical protein